MYITLASGLSVSGGSARISLLDATLTMTLTVGDGGDGGGGGDDDVKIRLFAPANRPEILAVNATAALNVTFVPRGAQSARASPTYTKNPPTVCTDVAGAVMCEQPLIAVPDGFGFATILSAVNQTTEILVSVGNAAPAGVISRQPARTLAQAALDSAVAAGPFQLLQEHTGWWADYWARSYLSVPDSAVESFHLIQLYKMASATRCDGPDNCWAYDLMGP
jgi:alpha-L-fucosidase 2